MQDDSERYLSRRHPEHFLSHFPFLFSGALLSTGISGKRDRNTVDWLHHASKRSNYSNEAPGDSATVSFDRCKPGPRVSQRRPLQDPDVPGTSWQRSVLPTDISDARY
ncbi:unnamed protein product [Boreogadus saida]